MLKEAGGLGETEEGEGVTEGLEKRIEFNYWPLLRCFVLISWISTQSPKTAGIKLDKIMERGKLPSLALNGMFRVVWDNYHYRATSIQQATFKLASRLSLPSESCIIARHGLYRPTQRGSRLLANTNTHRFLHTHTHTPSFFLYYTL